MERKEAIRGAYRLTGGNNFYDGMITCSTLSGKAVCRLVWDMNKAENDAYLEKALSGIPEHFSGRLLEVLIPAAYAKKRRFTGAFSTIIRVCRLIFGIIFQRAGQTTGIKNFSLSGRFCLLRTTTFKAGTEFTAAIRRYGDSHTVETCKKTSRFGNKINNIHRLCNYE